MDTLIQAAEALTPMLPESTKISGVGIEMQQPVEVVDRNAESCGGGGSSNTDNMKVENLKGEPLLTKSASFPLTVDQEQSDVDQELEETAGPAMLLLSSCPTEQQWDNCAASTKNGIQYYGSIAERPFGPVVGLVDIGYCEDAYFFRVSLPGVSRDANDFSCTIETDGQVLIKGVTVTGKKYIHKFSQIFELQTQNLPSPGPFTVSFKLPGPVDPRSFTGNFDDGIFEGIVLKQKS